MKDLVRAHEERVVAAMDSVARGEAKLRELDEENEFLPDDEKTGAAGTIGLEVARRYSSISRGLSMQRGLVANSHSALQEEYGLAADQGCPVPRALTKRSKGILVLAGLAAVGAGGVLAVKAGRR
jgi:hypothetical protein